MSTLAESSSAYRHLVEQLVNDSSFFWVMRSQALYEPHYSIEDLRELEGRMEASIQAMLSSPEDAWACAQENMVFEEGGEAFTAGILAFISGDVAKIKQVTDFACVNDETHKGLCDALAWLNNSDTSKWLKKFLHSTNLDHRYLAVRTYSALRVDPGPALEQLLASAESCEHERVLARSLRLVGELKRKNGLSHLTPFLNDERPTVKFWALWSAVLLGDVGKVDQLQPFVEANSPLWSAAMQVYCRTAGFAKSRNLISSLAKTKENLRLSILAAAALGDPKVVPWLIAQMQEKATARVAGEAFYQISGIDLEAHNLVTDEVDEDIAPSEDVEDDDVSLDDDEHLPWPNADGVGAMWKSVEGQFQANARYLLGKKIDHTNVTAAMQTATSRIRRAAAIEAALLQPQQVLVNIDGRSGG